MPIKIPDSLPATSILEGQGFVVIPKMESNDTVPVGLVIRTDPVQGTELTEGQDVYLFISSGPVTAQMPNVVGKSAAEANKALANAGLIMRMAGTTASSSGNVYAISQETAAGTELSPGEVVTVRFGDRSVLD